MAHSFSKRGQGGFSLLEVLIAVVIVSLGLLALASLQSALIRSAADAKSQTLAMAIAKQKIEQLAAYQTLGGFDNGCVSPTAWTAGAVSCYRAITDEGATQVDVDLSTVATDNMGGVAFSVATAVTRYVYNVATGLYVSADDTALDSALATTPETLLPGKEFKRIVTTVGWVDATGASRTIQVEDAINGIAPRDSIAIVNNRKGVLARTAESIIVNPGSVAGVIPIAVGNGSNTAASNPTPELVGQQSNQYAETRFDVYTYIPLNETTALAQSRVETAVVPCACSTSAASTVEKPLRPTYWNGERYAIPTQANYIGLTSAAATANRPLAGPKPAVEQSDQCRVCCRDHADPAGDDANGDPRSAVAKFSPRRSAHSHYLVTSETLGSPVVSGDYSEVCRMIRVDGIFRVAADLNNDYFALLEARNSGESSFVPSADVSDDYGDMVKKYLAARFSNVAATSSTYNDAASPDPYSNTYVAGTRNTSPTSTRTYDLNAPSTFYLKLSNDAKWLHARGLYIDYLEPEAVAKIDAAKATCTAIDRNECVLPYLPFTSINLSELADWKDVAVLPTSTGAKEVLDVMNRGFDLALGDTTFEVDTGSAASSSGSFTINFQSLGSSIVAGMAVSGPGVADNARVTAVDTSGADNITVDLPNTADILAGTPIVFQGAPVRGRGRPGTTVSDGQVADAQATASYNNAAIALKFPMNPDEVVLTDAQRFTFSAGGAPPHESAGSFQVSGFSVDGGAAMQPDAVGPKVYWGIANSSPSVANNCDLNNSTYPFTCPVSYGLGTSPPYGGMTIRIENYNRYVTSAASAVPYATAISVSSCYYKNGSTVGAGTLATGQASTEVVNQAYVTNYGISSATLAGSATTIGTVANIPSPSLQNINESTEIYISEILKSPTQQVLIEMEVEGKVMADYICCIAVKEPGNKYRFDRAEFRTPTTSTCSYTP